MIADTADSVVESMAAASIEMQQMWCFHWHLWPYWPSFGLAVADQFNIHFHSEM